MKIKNIKGWATRKNGNHTQLSEDAISEIIRAIEEKKKRIKKLMPDEQSAINMMHDAFQRLIDLGWDEACHCPKDGTPFKVIEAGSTGIFDCVYHGEWPKGYYLIGHDEDMCVSTPILFKDFKKEKITAAEMPEEIYVSNDLSNQFLTRDEHIALGKQTKYIRTDKSLEKQEEPPPPPKR